MNGRLQPGPTCLALALIMRPNVSPSLRPRPCPIIPVHVIPARRSAVLKAAGDSKEPHCPFTLSSDIMLEEPNTGSRDLTDQISQAAAPPPRCPFSLSSGFVLEEPTAGGRDQNPPYLPAAVVLPPPPRCPFSLSADFMLEEPRPQKLSPLGHLSVFSDRPATAHLWLEAAGGSGSRQGGAEQQGRRLVSGLKAAGGETPSRQGGAEQQGQRLVSGLRRLTHDEEFLPQDQEGDRHGRELQMKRRGFATRREHTFVAEPGSLHAQAEALELLLEYLPQRFPHMYSVRGGDAGSGGSGGGRRAVSVTVQSTGETHLVADYADRPLELCGRLVQVGFRVYVNAWGRSRVQG